MILPSCKCFVAEGRPCRHNLENIWRKNLESGHNRRIFANVNQNKKPLSDKIKKNMFNNKILKIMTQKNFMSARALAMEELENVNGGAWPGWWEDPRKKGFEIRVK